MKNRTENRYPDLITGYLQNKLNREETDEFLTWIYSDEENKKLYFEIKAIYDASLSTHISFDIQKSWNRLLKKRQSSTRKRIWYRAVSYAAITFTAVLLTSLFFFYAGDDQEMISRYIGGDGLAADVIELPDGSMVSLGSKSSFHYSSTYGKSDRTVYLEGEAYFEVTQDKDNPFIVKVPGQEIEVLGTKFNVMAYPTDSFLITTLLSGSIQLTTENLSKKIILKPNQQFIYNRNTQTAKLYNTDAQRFISWTTGYYYFPEQSLKAILQRLSNVYGITFTVRSETLNQCMFTGTFYHGQNIKDILEIINISIPIKYKIDDHHVTISE